MTHPTRVGARSVCLSLALAACASQTAPLRSTSPAPSTVGWTYEVSAGPGGEELAVEGSFPPGTLDELTVEEGGEPFLRNVEADTGAGFKALPARDLSWFLPTCARGCRVRYKVALGAAGQANRRVTIARADGGAVEAPPSTWLLRPVRAPRGTPLRFHVTPAPGEAFVSGVFPASAKDTYEGKASATFQLPYSAFGRLRIHERLSGVVQIAVLPGRLRDEAAMLSWVETAAKAVASFYGRFPVPRLVVIVRPAEGDGIGFGTAIGSSGAAIAIDVGADATPTDFKDDWVLVHEMIHTALPDLEGPHHWLEEGLSTYVEPLARTRAGLYGETDLWKDWIKGMPNGLPQDGDRGLDVTHTWGRTYWGGALFCLLADVEIRSRTGGRRSLDDALRAVVTHGGSIAESWPIARVIEIGDAATGVPVLAELYAKMATSPAPVDLADMWKRLGVAGDGRGGIALDDAAPLASVRRAMTAPRAD
jgi:hypothetical protein